MIVLAKNVVRSPPPAVSGRGSAKEHLHNPLQSGRDEGARSEHASTLHAELGDPAQAPGVGGSCERV